MRLAALRLDNFRSYKNPSNFESVKSISVLIGPNNSGKSNVLQALMWYRGMERGEQPPLLDFIHSGNRSNPLKLDFEFELFDSERQIVARDLLSRPVGSSRLEDTSFLRRIRHELVFEREGLHEETVSISNSSGKWLPLFGLSPKDNQLEHWRGNVAEQIGKPQGDGDIAEGKRRIIHTTGRGPVGFQWTLESNSFEFRVANKLREFLRRWFLFPPNRQMNPRISPGQEEIVQQGGANLVRVLNTIQTTDPDRFVSLTREVYKVVPGLERITAPPRGSEVTAVIREPGGVEIEAKDSSSGLQQVLILAISLLTYPENSLFAVEEPEIHLHASAQRALLKLMKTLAVDKADQFWIATHSTIFAQINPNVGTFLVEKRTGSSRVRELEELSGLQHLKHLLGHETSDLFGFDAVIIVEGDSEETALPIIADSLGMNLSSLGIKVVNIRGAGKTTRIEELLRFLKDSDTLPFVMLDNHPEVRKKAEDWVREKLVPASCLFIWEKEFEDCFDDSTISEAFNELARREGLSVSLTGDDLSRARAKEGVPGYLGRIVYETTGRALSKPDLGECIAHHLNTTRFDRKGSPPEAALEKIKEMLQK